MQNPTKSPDSQNGFFKKHSLAWKIPLLVLLAAALAGCFVICLNRYPFIENPPTAAASAAPDSSAYLAFTSLDSDTDPANAEPIDLSACKGGCEITSGGNYRLTGEMRGTLYIKAPDENVHLFLDGVSITSPYGPAILCEDTNKLVITLLPNTANSIADSGRYPQDSRTRACIFSMGDLTFNGSGTLKVSGLCEDAIRTRDILKILGGNFLIRSKRTALRGNDGMVISGGTFSISSQAYGLMTTKSGPYGRGNLVVSGGDLAVVAGRFVFVTEKADLEIRNCTVRTKSVVNAYLVAGEKRVEEGCVNIVR